MPVVCDLEHLSFKKYNVFKTFLKLMSNYLIELTINYILSRFLGNDFPCNVIIIKMIVLLRKISQLKFLVDCH